MLLSAFTLILLVSSSTHANAQYPLRQCNVLQKWTIEAMKQDAFKQVILLARERLTYCKHGMGSDSYTIALGVLATGLNGDRQYSEALAVANQCLRIDSAVFSCAAEKVSALRHMKRLPEAKATIESALRYPALTEFDVEFKKILRNRLQLISAELQSQPKQQPEEQIAGYGSGFFITDAGHIITNWHVVKNCRSLTATNETPLKFVRSNKSLDLAVLQAAGAKPTAVAMFRQTDAALGESIIAFGFPLAGLLSSAGNVTTGTVSATTGLRDDPQNLQITAPVQPGNSGGPLLDQFGNVVGIVVAKLDAIKAASLVGDIPRNVNFAIKGREVIAFLNEANVTPTISKASTFLKTEVVAASAASFTVQISLSFVAGSPLG
jgi:S1-C subfamily serine protease